MKVAIALLITLFICALADAQQPSPTPTPAAVRHRARLCCVSRRPAVIKAPTPLPTPTPSPVAADFFVSEAKVDVTKDETVVRLAMAQHGSVLIELPANDGPRYIIPGDPEMATVDEKALESNKRAIIVRPGAQFVPPLRNRLVHSPAATVTAQMRSGLVVTFLFYPVEDLSQNVHRCVLSYKRDEVVARRRAAGLPVNLDTTNNERGTGTAQNAATLSSSIAIEDPKSTTPNAGNKSATTAPSPIEAKTRPESAAGTMPASSRKPPASESGERSDVPNQPAEFIALTRHALSEALKQPKQLKTWTKPLHSVSLSVVSRADYAKGLSVAIVAVRNTSTGPLKLLAGSPELFLETLDDQRRSINRQTVAIACTELSDASRSLAAGSTVYLAIAYSTPVLDAHQQLQITIAQTNAADEPASIALASRKH